MMETIKSQIKQLSDSDLLELLDYVSEEVKNRNESVLGKVDVSDDPVGDMIKALESLGLGVSAAYGGKKSRF
jgi:hypothetical protein